MSVGAARGIPGVVFVCVLGMPAAAQTGHEHHTAAAGKPTAIVGGLRIPDAVLVNEKGEKIRLFSDLIQGKTAAIHTIFTTCTTICPLMGANFAKVSKLLGDRTDVRLISISIDPTVDTPERLAEWRRGFGATGANWTLLTGDRNEGLAGLKALQVFTPDKQDHEPVVLVGRDGDAAWSRTDALKSAQELVELIRSKAGH